MMQTVASAIRALNPLAVVFAMDGGHTHRTSLLPAYKAHRPPSDPDLVRQRELAEQAIQIAGFQTIRVVGWEADDVIASLATRYSDVVICSSDKDLLALAGRARIYHPWSGGEFVDPESKLGIPAGQVTDYLALCGDTSDGIPGVKGIGPKSAAQLLEKHGSLESILTAARCLRIPGSVGEKLRDHSADALLCRRVVELNTTLPLPEIESWSPRALWQKRLTDMSLGNIAAIMDGLIASGSLRQIDIEDTNWSALSATTAQVEQSEITSEADNADRLASAVAADHSNEVEEARPIAAHTTNDPHTNSTEDSCPQTQAGVDAENSVGGNGSLITRSITEPIRDTRGWTTSQIYDGPDRGLIWLWERGRKVAAGLEPRNPDSVTGSGRKSGTDHDTAWQQGFAGQDLRVHLTPSTTSAHNGERGDVSPPVPPAVPSASTKRPAVRSLF